jgi:uncharacterized membrane protein
MSPSSLTKFLGSNQRFSNLILIISLLITTASVPYFHSLISRIFALILTSIFAFLWIFIDHILTSKSSSEQKQRITLSNYLALSLLLLPIAGRCTPGTWANLIFDTAVYLCGIMFAAFAGAARLELLLHSLKINCNLFSIFLFPASIVIYCVVLGVQLTAYYNAYSMEWFDNAYTVAPVWQMFRNGFFRIINEFSMETIMLQAHWSFIYVVLSPITLLWKSPVAIHWISVIFSAAGAVPVFLLAKHYTGSRQMAAVIGSLYLLYLPVHLATLYGFHPDPLAVPFILFAFYCAAKKKWPGYWVSVVAAISCIEYSGLAFTGYGIWLAFNKNLRLGIATCILGAGWCLFVTYAGLPLFNHGAQAGIIACNYGDMGGSGGLSEMARYSVTHIPETFSMLFRQSNIVAFVSMLLPFLFLPLLRSWILAAGVFLIVKNALSSTGLELLVHRETLFFPFVVYGLILFLAKVHGAKRRFLTTAVYIATAATFMLQGHAFPARGFWLTKSDFVKTAHDKTCDRILSRIPKDASVMSSSHLSPHVMDRKWYFLFPRFPATMLPEYVIVDTIEQMAWPWMGQQELRDGFLKIRNSEEYGLCASEDGVFLFSKTFTQASSE